MNFMVIVLLCGLLKTIPCLRSLQNSSCLAVCKALFSPSISAVKESKLKICLFKKWRVIPFNFICSEPSENCNAYDFGAEALYFKILFSGAISSVRQPRLSPVHISGSPGLWIKMTESVSERQLQLCKSFVLEFS